MANIGKGRGGLTRRLAVEYRAASALVPYSGNARTHSKKQIRQIADSIEQFGFTNPIIIDDDGGVLCGHGRLAAARLIGLEEVPTVRLTAMSAAEKRAYMLADNRLAELAGWDDDLLKIEFQFLIDADLDFPIEIIGFEAADIDRLMTVAPPTEEPPVELPAPGAPVVTRAGDLWIVGPHRLICGDARDTAIYERLLGSNSAEMIFTDPPYNVPVAGHVSGLGRNSHREFAMASGEMSPGEFTRFLRAIFARLTEASTSGSIHFICMDWRHMRELLDAAAGIYAELKNLVVWTKTNAGMGTFYRSQHELVFTFKAGKGRHINNFGLGEKGRHRTNVWAYAGANTFRAGRDADLADHPTVKPVQMVVDAILDCSKPGGIILDAFVGAGTTLVAAARANRVGYGIEIDPAYVDCALKRVAAETGLEPILEMTGQTFGEVAADRASKEGA